jgi:hypothetical protein
MRKAMVLATALMFSGSSLASALPTSVGTPGQVLAASESPLALVAQKKAKKAMKTKKTKKSSKSGDRMNMQGMPPGHKM